MWASCTVAAGRVAFARAAGGEQVLDYGKIALVLECYHPCEEPES